MDTKSNKNVFDKNTIMTNIIKHCRGEKKRGIRAIDGFRKKLFIPDYEISVSIEHVVNSKIGTIFANEDIVKSILSRFMKLILILVSIIKKYKLIVMVNNAYCLELMIILLNIV